MAPSPAIFEGLWRGEGQLAVHKATTATATVERGSHMNSKARIVSNSGERRSSTAVRAMCDGVLATLKKAATTRYSQFDTLIG